LVTSFDRTQCASFAPQHFPSSQCVLDRARCFPPYCSLLPRPPTPGPSSLMGFQIAPPSLLHLLAFFGFFKLFFDLRQGFGRFQSLFFSFFSDHFSFSAFTFHPPWGYLSFSPPRFPPIVLRLCYLPPLTPALPLLMTWDPPFSPTMRKLVSFQDVLLLGFFLFLLVVSWPLGGVSPSSAPPLPPVVPLEIGSTSPLPILLLRLAFLTVNPDYAGAMFTPISPYLLATA